MPPTDADGPAGTMRGTRVPATPIPGTRSRITPATVVSGTPAGSSSGSGGATRPPSVPSGVVPRGLGSIGAGSRYEFSKELGRGAVGVVMAAEDPELRRNVAIKLLLRPDDPDAVSQFIEEAQITGQLEHPNIIPVHELGRDQQGRPWLAMKRIDGINLGQLIGEQQPGPLGAEDITRMLALFGKIADAVSFAHSRGVIHRDLKPDNILIGDFGEVLVGDWGLARPVREKDGKSSQRRPSMARAVTSARRVDEAHQTMDGEIFGTPAYMPPEQADGRTDEVDERSDIFALGAILYHMLTLERPYVGNSVQHVVMQAVQRQLLPPRQRAPHRHIPPGLDAIVMKAMAAAPRERYASVRTLQKDLDAWQANLPITARRDSPVQRAVKWARRNPALALGSTMSVVFIMLLAAIGALWSAQVAGESQRRAQAEADAAREGQRAADERRERERSDAARQRADDARELAEEKQRIAQLRALAEAGRVDDLLGELGMKLDLQLEEELARFYDRMHEALSRGISLNSYVEHESQAEVNGFVAAFNRLVEANRKYGDRIQVRPVYWAMLAMLQLLRFNKPEEAVRCANEALKIDPQCSGAYSARGAARAAMNDPAGAEADCSEALSIDPENVDAWNTRGLAHRKQDNLAGALSDFSAALRIQPDMVAALVNRGVTYGMMKNADAAVADLNQALTYAPEMPEALYNRAMVFRQTGEYRAAIRDYELVLTRDPRLIDARYELAMVRKLDGDLDGAIADFDLYIKANDDPDARLNRGVCWLNKGDADRALQDFDAVLAVNPDEALAHFNRGQAFRAKKQFDLAVKAFNESVRLDPKHANSWNCRGNARHELEDLKGALDDYAHAIELEPDNAEFITNRGVVRAGLDDTAGAIEDFRRVTQLAPTIFQGWFNLGMALKESGDRAASLAALKEAWRRCKDEAIRERIAEAIREQGGTVPR
ncbi:MAG: tetratricopeptide repeat protein [Planctomycetota bacterium]